MVGERWLGYLMRWLVLGSTLGAGGCASVEYRVPIWEVRRLTQLPPAMRGGEVRVIPVEDVVPPPVADTPAPPEIEVGVDVQLPVVVATAPPPVIVAPRPVLTTRNIGAPVAAGPRGAPPTGGGWKTAPTATAGARQAAPTPTRTATAARIRSSGGGQHGSGGGRAAGAAAGAVAVVGLVVLLAETDAAAAAADAARRYNGWVTVDGGHPLHLFYGGGLGRVVPLAQLGPADLTGLLYAMLDENDGHVEPLRQPPPPAAALPQPPPQGAAALPQPPPQVASPQPTPVSPPLSGPVATQPPAPALPPAPVAQVADPETP